MSSVSVKRVLLLHGIWMPGASMQWMAARLRKAGFNARIQGYPGSVGGPLVSLPILARSMRDADAVVAHSLGGLMTLETLRRYEDLPIGRVVCLASPLCGSSAARHLRRHWWGSAVLHRCADFLAEGLPAWEGKAEVGMIAGSRARGMGRYFTRFDGVSDGTVGIEETRLPGLRDFCQIDASHSGILFSEKAFRQTAAFLRIGTFD